MKKFKLIEEVGWMLTEDARRDMNLNAVDKNLLAILQFIEDGKSAHGEWFRILIKHPNGKWDDDNFNSIEKYFNDFEIPTAYCTLNRSVNKLLRLGYIDYKTGWYNNTTHQGMPPMIKLLKGTIPIKCGIIATAQGDVNLNDNKSATCSDIAIAKGNNSEQLVNGNSEKLTTDKSASYSDIAIAYEKENYNYKETYNYSSIELNNNTYNLSDSKGDDDEDLEYMERYGIDKLSYILQYNDDWLPVMEYLQKHPTKSNYDKIEAYWADNDEYLGYLHNLNNSSLRITV